MTTTKEFLEQIVFYTLTKCNDVRGGGKLKYGLGKPKDFQEYMSMNIKYYDEWLAKCSKSISKYQKYKQNGDYEDDIEDMINDYMFPISEMFPIVQNMHADHQDNIKTFLRLFIDSLTVDKYEEEKDSDNEEGVVYGAINGIEEISDNEEGVVYGAINGIEEISDE